MSALGNLNLQGTEDLTLSQSRVLAEFANKGSTELTELPAGTYKVFHFDVGDFYLDVNSGKYYFDLDDSCPLVNGMNLGDTHSLKFSVTVTDADGASGSHDFTINISGRNDRPEMTVNEDLTVTTDHLVTEGMLSDLVTVNDADVGDTHTFYIASDPTMSGKYPGHYNGSQNDWSSNKLENFKPLTELSGKYGTLTIDPATGKYTYMLNGEYQGKDVDLSDEVFYIAVKDSNGAFDIQDIHVTVSGAVTENLALPINDAPSVQDSYLIPDGLEGMIASADTIEHGTAGHDMLVGSYGSDVLYGEGGHDLMVGDGHSGTLDVLNGLVHTDSTSDLTFDTIHSMTFEQLHGLSDGLETFEHQTDGNDFLMGGEGNDVLIGMGGNDVLYGGDGHDILLGGSGDDILVGGSGDDVLVGGSGHDVFQYHQGDLDGVVNGDHIVDFHLGDHAQDTNADVLDIGDLLHGSNAKADGSDLFSGGFLQLEVLNHDDDKGTATVQLSIDQDGAAGSDYGSVALATIDMNGIHGLGGMNPQEQADQLMQQLMDNHAIKM